MSRNLADLCYNIPGESIYGEITSASVAKLVEKMQFPTSCIHVLDIGSGSGYMLFEFLCALLKSKNVSAEIQLSGIEISEIRFQLSTIIFPKLLLKCPAPTKLNQPQTIKWQFIQDDISHLKQLPKNVTHTISFDITFLLSLMLKIEKLQRLSPTLLYVISNHYLKVYSPQYWEKIAQVSCALVGSGTHKIFYVFKKKIL